jgi:hypothetical protein
MQCVSKYAYHGASSTVGIPIYLRLPKKIGETGCANLFLCLVTVEVQTELLSTDTLTVFYVT